jgi:hypothetical protein
LPSPTSWGNGERAFSTTNCASAGVTPCSAIWSQFVSSQAKITNKIIQQNRHLASGISEWLRRRVDEFTPESLHAAREVDPADALCLARRARNFALAADPDPYWADLYSKLALKLAPSDAEAAWRAVLVLAGRGAEAAAVAGRAAGTPAGDAWSWEAKWEAWRACSCTARPTPLPHARPLAP